MLLHKVYCHKYEGLKGLSLLTLELIHLHNLLIMIYITFTYPLFSNLVTEYEN